MERREVLTYGILGLPLAFGALPIYLFVPDLYARSGLLGLSAIGFVLLLTRLIDGIADPCFGWLIDRYPRKPVLLGALIPFGVGFVALFTPGAIPVDPIVALFVTLAFCTLGFSGAMIAYQAWGSDLGQDTVSRLRLTAAREAFILAGVVIAAVIPTLISDDPLIGMQQLPWFMLAFLFLAVIMLCRVPSGMPHIATGALLDRLRLTLSDRRYRRLLLVFFANGIASAFPATLFVFYVTDVLQAPSYTGLLLAVYFLSAALAMPFWVHIVQRLGRPRTWILAMLLAMAAFSSAAALGEGGWPLFLIICVISGIAVGTDLTIPASIVADLGESNGSAGTYFGVWNLVAKVNLALAAGIALPLLSYLGYTPGSTDHTAVLIGTYVLLPLGLKAIAIVLLYCWREDLSITLGIPLGAYDPLQTSHDRTNDR